MRKSIRRTLAGLALVAGAGVATAASAQVAGVPQPEQSCQRECLEGFVDRYLQAMADGKVDPELFAPAARFTENGIELPLGNEGLWATTSAVGNYKFYVPDVETQQVAFLGTVMEQASSSATGPAREPEAVGSPHPIFLEAVPESERMTRAELVAVGDSYFEAVERNTGKDYYPFTDDCLRYENGMIIVGPPGTTRNGQPVQGCKEQLETSLIGAVTGIRDRRIVAVDRERGIVFAFAFFDHRPINWSWQLGELFKIEDGKISRIEAIFIRGPYGICSGWSTYEQCRSEEPQDVR